MKSVDLRFKNTNALRDIVPKQRNRIVVGELVVVEGVSTELKFSTRFYNN